MIITIHVENNQIVKKISNLIKLDETKCRIIHSLESEKVMEEYSEFLHKEEHEYSRLREKSIASYIQDRKTLRNIRWYIKRLRLNYFLLLLYAYRNKKFYIKFISDNAIPK